MQHPDLLLQHTSKISETLEIYVAICFQCNISLLLGRMKACQCVEFTDVELAGGAELTAPVEKAAADSM
jgi:hypothetical protein